MASSTRSSGEVSADAAAARSPRFILALVVMALAVTAAVVWFVFGRRQEEPQTVDALVEQRRELDATVWADEAEAQKYERPFVRLWDELRGSNDWLAVLEKTPLEQVLLGEQGERIVHDQANAVETRLGGEGRTITAAQWPQLLADWRDEGFRLVESEWHHSRFQPGDAPRSTVAMLLHVANDRLDTRYIIRGDLEVEWAAGAVSADGKESSPAFRTIDARNLKVFERSGPTDFTQAHEIIMDRVSPNSPIVFVVIVYDLDGDGLSDIILPRENNLYRNQGGFKFKNEPLTMHGELRKVTAAVVADFTSDGNADILCCAPGDPAALYAGDAQGAFKTAPLQVNFPEPLELPSAVTAGDVDGDGDLDAFVAQYRAPYNGGQMPTPYYDSNDGAPAYLLINKGQGEFEDGTAAAGLAPLRFRRTYSASLVDIDEDGDLDLLTANDFAGLDVQVNDGQGKFTDVTSTFVDKRHSFGMSLTFGDYNNDTLTDFYLIGMSSTTARRLTQLGLGRDNFPEHQEFRPEMGYGNRMLLAQGTPGAVSGFKQAPFNDQVARTGWSWGATSFDFDNDADRDIYVANGHISGKTAEDYCTRFWCHDIYTGSSKTDPLMGDFFKVVLKDEMGERSWNGFEHNCLLVNQAGQGFLSLGFLAGVGLENDSRNVVGDDFDADGRPDLLVTTGNLQHGMQLRLFKNQSTWPGHWVGVRLREGGLGKSPHGARVSVTADGKTQVVPLLSGDSSMSQHAAMVHFGLGEATAVESLVVRWPDGTESKLDAPAIDQYHTVTAPAAVP